jgi:ATP-dependent DNA helicase RecG
MIRRCRDAGLSEPTFALDDGFRLTLWRPAPPGPNQGTTVETTQETTAETTQEMPSGTSALGKPREGILSLMRQQPTITTKELADALQLSPDGVSYHLKKLRAEGRIRRHGPTKSGRWEVLP